MSREIKFRAYILDPYEGDSWRIEQPSCGAIGLKWFWKEVEGLPTSFKVNTVQYTGLKDKNGVEVYKGDILGDPDETLELRYRYISVVEWNDWFMAYEPFFREPSYKQSHFKQVIGNIYENPELLESER